MTEKKPQAESENQEVEFAEDQNPQDSGQDASEEIVEDSGEESLLNEESEVTVETVIEAILFASDEPLNIARLADIAEISGGAKQVREAIEALNEKYRNANCAFRVEEIAGGFQMMTLSVYNNWLRKLLRVRTDNKLTQASLETLAIVAYKQPIIRADVEAIRGVASGELIRSLMYKGLVKIVGRAEVLGRPMLYGTTKKFLEIFGLNTLKDLPKVEELKNPN
ncbi:MAG: SMC-Scp complex subunit ScpB [Anaerohalosphaeraceae bacterium]|nr:SMC-Scp complex subunit ScpB [Anaerohalosphaeraceae bacterium]